MLTTNWLLASLLVDSLKSLTWLSTRTKLVVSLGALLAKMWPSSGMSWTMPPCLTSLSQSYPLTKKRPLTVSSGLSCVRPCELWASVTLLLIGSIYFTPTFVTPSMLMATCRNLFLCSVVYVKVVLCPRYYMSWSPKSWLSISALIQEFVAFLFLALKIHCHPSHSTPTTLRS